MAVHTGADVVQLQHLNRSYSVLYAPERYLRLRKQK